MQNQNSRPQNGDIDMYKPLNPEPLSRDMEENTQPTMLLEQVGNRQATNPDLAGGIGAIAIEHLTLESLAPSVAEATKQVANAYEEKAQQAVLAIEQNGPFIPAAAAAIAVHRNPSINLAQKMPSAADIKQLYPPVGNISSFLGRFSSKLSGWFDRFAMNYVVKKATNKIEGYSSLINAELDVISQFEQPKTVFLNEIANMYNYVVHDNPRKPGEGPDDRLAETLRQLHFLYRFHQGVDEDYAMGYDKGAESFVRQYPLIGMAIRAVDPGSAEALSILNKVGNKGQNRAVAPEIINGIEQFLSFHGVTVPPANLPTPDTLTRKVGEKIRGSTIEALPASVASILSLIYAVLPTDGRQFANEVYDASMALGDLADQGVSGQAIAGRLTSSFKRPTTSENR